MLFENAFILPTLYVMLTSFLIGFVGVILLFYAIKKKMPHANSTKLSHIPFKAALIGGLSTSIFLGIMVSTLTPSVITINSESSYSEDYSFFGDEEFLGLGGSYIVNKSGFRLRLIGIGSDDDIDVVIPSGEIVKIRKCPERYFVPVPDHQSTQIVHRRGKRKAIKGASVFLVKQ